MRLQLKLTRKSRVYEIFSLGFYTIDRARLCPSFYRNPFWSFRWFKLNITFDCFKRLYGVNA